MNILQKYIGVIGAAFFAAAGIEYFSAYVQGKKIFDATAPIRMAKTEYTGASPSAVMETSVSNDISTKSALDQQVPENGTMNPISEIMKAGTGNASSRMEAGPSRGAPEVHALVLVNASSSGVTGRYPIRLLSRLRVSLMPEGGMGFMTLFLSTPKSGSFSGVFL